MKLFTVIFETKLEAPMQSKTSIHLVTIKDFERNLQDHKRASSQFLDTLNTFVDIECYETKVEFFFHTWDKLDAVALKDDLVKMGYEVYVIDNDSIRKKWTVTGSTLPMSIKNKKLNSWIDAMSELGFVNNCLFDGFGTEMEV